MVHLKADILDHLTMCYLRLLVQTEAMFNGENNADEDSESTNTSAADAESDDLDPASALNFTKITSLGEEKKVALLYRKMLLHVLKEAESNTTLI